jgi:hypothetical protein
MVIQGDVISLSNKEVKELIDRECRKRLDMSGREFLERREKGKLPKSTAVHDIEILLKLA